MTDFNTAKSYQIEGYDKYESVGECLAAWVAGDSDGDGGFTDGYIRSLFMPTVHAYRLADRVHLGLDNMSDDMMTTFENAFADENLCVTDDIDRLKSADAYRRCKNAIWTALAEFEESLPVTRLETKPFASRAYTADEVIAILREVRPRWFREVANG